MKTSPTQMYSSVPYFGSMAIIGTRPCPRKKNINILFYAVLNLWLISIAMNSFCPGGRGVKFSIGMGVWQLFWVPLVIEFKKFIDRVKHTNWSLFVFLFKLFHIWRLILKFSMILKQLSKYQCHKTLQLPTLYLRSNLTSLKLGDSLLCDIGYSMYH